MIVDEFIENPKILSIFAAGQRIHWANFLSLLHLLLIKHGEKKISYSSATRVKK